MNYKIISVESRKGGVGKTTAALNISNLLVEKGYKVLLLDVDITGTSIEGSYNSSFWMGRINPVKQNGKEINLLEIFHNNFLKGEGIPIFSLNNEDIIYNERGFKQAHDFVENKNFIISENKINIFNSEIYNNNDSSLICDPRILFDELHSFWLIEMIELLCNSFADCINDVEKTVIVLDNSPGYVGLGKAIHDWLTDIGPEYGKFLTISSLDVQDLNSCLSAIQAIENIVNQKLEGAKYYNQLKNNADISNDHLTKESKKFFLNLATNKNTNGRYSYYKTGEAHKKELYTYQSLIINKAPLEIKSETLYFDVSRSLKNDVNKRNIFELFSGEQRDRKFQNVIYFDNYIHFQFIEPFIEKTRNDRYDRKREYSSLKGSFTKIENEIAGNQEREIEYNYSQFLNTIESYENTLSKLLSRLIEAGYDNIVRLIEEKWHPQIPLIKIQQVFENLCENMPFLERYSSRNDYREDIVDEDYFQNEIKSLLVNIEHLIYRESNLFYQKKRDQFSLETLCFFLLRPYLKRSDFDKREESFFRLMLIFILAVQNERLKRNRKQIYDNKKSFLHFLANENITSNEIRKYRHIIKEIPYKFIEKEFFHEDIFDFFEGTETLLPNFYNSFCHTLARLIDMHDDFKFLISVLRNVTIDDKNERTVIFPNIRDILNDVIIKKTVSYSLATKRMYKEFQGAQYMSDFREVLKNNVISKWNL